MAKTISLRHDYAASADAVWNLATDIEALDSVNRPRIVMTGLPKGRIHQGQVVNVDVSLFGIMPKKPYSMTVVKCDDAARSFESSEKGAGVKSWRHKLQVIDTACGSAIEETISIDAGLLTPLFAAWAKYLYRARHPVRQKLLGET